MKKHLLLALVTSVLMTSCGQNIQVTDGKIPDAYVGIAKEFEGEYPGKFGNIKGHLKYYVDGNEPKVEFVANNGSSDVFGGKCESKIGKLVAIQSANRNRSPEIWTARFEFNPNNCKKEVEGRSLYLNFKNLRSRFAHIEASVYVKTVSEYDPCTIGDPGCFGSRDVALHHQGIFPLK